MLTKMHFLKLCSAILIMLASDFAMCDPPPNPTASDASGSTAGGTGVLISNNGINNTGFGMRALGVNNPYEKKGDHNTAFGSYALYNNNGHSPYDTNIGSYNTGIGSLALFGLNNGSILIGNVSDAWYASGNLNTANGYKSLYSIERGSKNTAVGAQSLSNNSKGNFNTAIGESCLLKSEGNGNTALGLQALMKKEIGNYNLALGVNAGVNLTTGNSNVYIANPGKTVESSTIRIGNPSQNRFFVAGIRGIKTGSANAVPVVIDSNGQLGTINSSARFKKDIRDMNETSTKLMQLRPVTYRYKEADTNGENPLEFGLIAEEVAKVYPDLVAYGADGKIETVQYQKLTPMLLNELQHTNRLLQADDRKIQKLTQEIGNLKKQVQEVAHLKQQVTALQTQVQKFELLSARFNRIEAQQLLGINR